MKTTLHLPHPHSPAAATSRSARHAIPGRSTLRLGIVLSTLAALAAIVVEAFLDVPVALIVVPVVVVGFALSWHASGRRRRPPRRATMTR